MTRRVRSKNREVWWWRASFTLLIAAVIFVAWLLASGTSKWLVNS